MKIRIKHLVATLCVLFLLISSSASAYNGDTIVYVTRTGECYHTETCSYLKSKISISLEDAVANGYRACSRCHPPQLDTSRLIQPAAPIATLPPVRSAPLPTPKAPPPVATIQPDPAATSPPETRVIIPPTSVKEAEWERSSAISGVIGLCVGGGAVALYMSKKKR